MGDPSRLRLLSPLAAGERCVSDLAEGEGLSTVLQRLRVLHADGAPAAHDPEEDEP